MGFGRRRTIGAFLGFSRRRTTRGVFFRIWSQETEQGCSRRRTTRAFLKPEFLILAS